MAERELIRIPSVVVILPNVGGASVHEFPARTLDEIFAGSGIEWATATEAQIKDYAVRYTDTGQQDMGRLQITPTDAGDWLVSPAAKWGVRF